MIECTNVDMQDQLPDLLAGMLSVEQREVVEAHIALCATCRAEFALLETVRRVRPAPPALDIAAIVAALPTPGANASAERSNNRAFRVITGGQATEAASPRRTARIGTNRPAVFGQTFMRYAAVLTLVAVGGLSLVMADRSPTSLTDGTQLDSSLVARAPFDVAFASDATPYSSEAVLVQPVVSVAPSVLPIQELSAYSDAELTLLMEQLEAWDGATYVDSTAANGGTGSQGGS